MAYVFVAYVQRCGIEDERRKANLVNDGISLKDIIRQLNSISLKDIIRQLSVRCTLCVFILSYQII